METRRLTKMALLTALLCISAYISFPLPFSPAMVTALTLVATLIGLLLQPKDALIVFIIYILLGAVGLPVFCWRYGWSWQIVGTNRWLYFFLASCIYITKYI